MSVGFGYADLHINDVNRFATTDSKLSLDADSPTRDAAFMTQQCSNLYFQRIDPSRNMARYYALSIQPTLFGETSLIRAWGRIGTLGQEMSHHFASEADAIALLLQIARRKRAKGYVAKAICGKSPEEAGVVAQGR
ncbi:putative DNA-binding WGR domain protein [Ensifer sp. 4252]